MSTFTLAISCLPTFNLPWFMDLTFQVPMQYCSLKYQTLLLSPVTSTTVLFLLWLHHFLLSAVISPLISSSILGTYQPEEFIFQCPILSPFHTIHGVLKVRMLKWLVTPFSSGPCFFRILHHDPTSWVALHGMAHSFIELDKNVVHVIRLVSFLWLWFSIFLPSDGEG